MTDPEQEKALECMFCGNQNVPQLWQRRDGVACLPEQEGACRARYDKRVLAGAARLREERDEWEARCAVLLQILNDVEEHIPEPLKAEIAKRTPHGAGQALLERLAKAEREHAADLEDLRMIIRHCTAVYEYASGGVVTKPNTYPSEVIALSQERENRDREEAATEAAESMRERCLHAAKVIQEGWRQKSAELPDDSRAGQAFAISVSAAATIIDLLGALPLEDST